MKWLQHQTNSRNDRRLKRVIAKFGATGYGVYWAVNEIIAENLDKNIDCILEHTPEDLAFELNLDVKLVTEILDFLVEVEAFKKHDKTIANKKVLNFADEWTKKKLRIHSVATPEPLQSNSGQKGSEVKVREGKRSEVKVSKTSVSDSPKRAFTDWFVQEFEKSFGRKYHFQGAKDGKAADALIKSYALDELKKLVLAGWKDQSRFIQENCMSIAGFSSQVNKITVQTPTSTKSIYDTVTKIQKT